MVGSAILALAGGCSPSETHAPDGADAASVDVPHAADAAGGWVAEVAVHPEAFAALVGTHQAGWVAMQAHAYEEALAAFDGNPVGRVRAELALASMYGDLAEAEAFVHTTLFDKWEARSPLPEGPDPLLAAALGAACAGNLEAEARWGARAKGAKGPDGALAEILAAGGSPFDPTLAGGPFGARAALHAKVRADHDPAALLAVAGEPIVRVPADGFVREFWDPCLYRTLAAVWLDRAVADANPTEVIAVPAGVVPAPPVAADPPWRRLARLTAPEAGLGSSLFAPWGSTSDLDAELRTVAEVRLLGARAPSYQTFGLGGPSSPTDDPEAVRAEIRMLDAGLDAVQRRISDVGAPEGLAVVRDLGLVERMRQEWLIVRARRALAESQPFSALTLLEVARDHAVRTPGPENGPAVYALIALTRLRLGHTREALDALHALAEVRTEVRGLVETTGVLAVLETIDRRGDSKEDP